MKDKKIILMNSIRCNLYMAKRATNKDIKAKYIAMLKENVVVYKKLLKAWNSSNQTGTYEIKLVA